MHTDVLLSGLAEYGLLLIHVPKTPNIFVRYAVASYCRNQPPLCPCRMIRWTESRAI